MPDVFVPCEQELAAFEFDERLFLLLLTNKEVPRVIRVPTTTRPRVSKAAIAPLWFFILNI